MCQQAWSRLVRSSFRKNYTFPENASHNWFPGHMQKWATVDNTTIIVIIIIELCSKSSIPKFRGLKSMQRKMADVDCVLEVDYTGTCTCTIFTTMSPGA